MLRHEQVWRGIDKLATHYGFSTSGLAKAAGLDPTSFNKSKRFNPEGKERWPSMESISKVLLATGATMSEFIDLAGAANDDVQDHKRHDIPVIGYTQAGQEGFFDDAGYPAGDGWDHIPFPPADIGEGRIFALKVSGDSMEPLYRSGDIVMVDPDAQLREGDRIVLKTTDGEVMAKEYLGRTPEQITLRSLNPLHGNRVVPTNKLAWISRILWVSQ